MAPGTLTVKFVNGALTHDTDLIGKMDPYVKAWVGGQEYRTKTASSQGKTPRWDESKTFTVKDEQEIRLEVWDYDTIGKDDLVGKGEVNINTLPPGVSSLDVPLTYGNNKSAGTIRLEFNFIVAGGAQGAVLQQSQALYAKTSPNEKAAAAGLGGGTIEVKVISAYLTHDTEFLGQMDPYIKAFLGTAEKRTRTIQRGGKKPVWNETLSFPMAGEEMMRFECWDEENLGLDDSVGNGSFNIRTLAAGKTKVEIPLKYQGDSAGTLTVEFTKIPPGTAAHTVVAMKSGPTNYASPDLGARADRAGMGAGTLTLKLIGATLSRDTDLIGSMDPYVKIFVGGEEKKTTVANSQGKRPIWNESFTFRVSAGDSVRFEIWDYDTLKSDDLICEGVFPLRDLRPGTMMNDVPLNYKGKQAGTLQLEYSWTGSADMATRVPTREVRLDPGINRTKLGTDYRRPEPRLDDERLSRRLNTEPDQHYEPDYFAPMDYNYRDNSPREVRGSGVMRDMLDDRMPKYNMRLNRMNDMDRINEMNRMDEMNSRMINMNKVNQMNMERDRMNREMMNRDLVNRDLMNRDRMNRERERELQMELEREREIRMERERELMMERERGMMTNHELMNQQLSRSQQNLATSIYSGGSLPFPGLVSPMNVNPVKPLQPLLTPDTMAVSMMEVNPMSPMSPHGPMSARNMGDGPVFGFQGMNGPRWTAPIATDRKTLKMVTEQVFWTFDQLRRGKLEYYEFYPAFCELCRRMGCPPPSMQQIWFIMQRFDNNLDRRISYKEFKSIAKELFGHYHKRGRYAYY